MSAGLALSSWDIVVFLGFLAVVVGISLYASRREKTSADYFLAGRKLTWPLIGISLIASNISTEHFVGMSGSAFGRVGLAIASYEWIAAICLVFVAWWLLPKFLKAGIYTMPQFLEYRFDSGARAIMATYMMVAYVIVLLGGVLYSGAIALNTIFDIPAIFAERFGMAPDDATYWAMIAGIWSIGLIAGVYTVYGGLKAVVWSDLIQGGALLIGGAIVTVLGLQLLGDGNLLDGWRNFTEVNQAKLHVVLPWNDPTLPWLAVFAGGLWIPNIFYWGLNQFITQRTLGAKNLAEGQKGILLAAFLKLLIPFIIVIPGIMAFQLYGAERPDLGDKAYPYMISQILPPSLRGVMFAALCGAVMSTFNSGLNSASTIFTIDIYQKYLNKNASEHRQVSVGRIATAFIVVVSCLWAPVIMRFEGVFQYIQEVWGYITPGIVAAFIVGLIVKKAPPIAAKSALLVGPVLYGLCRAPKWIWDGHYASLHPGIKPENIVPPEGVVGGFYQFSSWAFLHHQGIVFVVLAILMLAITAWRPLAKPVTFPTSEVDTTIHPQVYLLGSLVIAATVALYVIFW